ncbi:MmgE/PrpD family protein [Pseudonocardia sp. NPDC049154]|uniref:MmgE/PrpD family protein n=1 Tax=Pseudonocardia sp. NPDC049154 TaxID=3155501 RepID=UPI0033C5576B
MSAGSRPGLTTALGRYAVEADLSGVPAAALALARRTLVDTVGVALGARHDPAVMIARTLVGTGGGGATVLTDGTSVRDFDAALLNGVAAHALDYDDVVDALYGHPSTVLWPALLATGEDRGSTTRELVDAYLVAFDVELALTEGFTLRRHYARGWHSTATLGVLGAAAGVARLLGATPEQAAVALGIAASMAGGSRQNFGTMTKPLHAGLAARDGVLAARLATAGFTADTTQLEGPLGFFALYGDGPGDLDRVLPALPAEPGTAVLAHGVNVKKYPACYNTQRTLDAALEIAARGLDPAEIDEVRLTVEPGGLDPLIHHRPTTGLEGKFSAEYAVAAALLDRAIGLRTYTTDAVRRPAAQQLLARVWVAEQARPPLGPSEWDQAYAVLEVGYRSGKRETNRVDVPHGDRRAPLDDADLRRKFVDCLDFAGLGAAADTVHTQLTAFGDDTPFTGFGALAAAR